MFVLRYLGSILKVEQPSEIVISDAGVKVTPLEESTLPVGYVSRPLPTGPRFPKQVDPQLEANALALGEAVVAELPKRGKVKDPNSLHSLVHLFVGNLLKHHPKLTTSEVREHARAAFPNANPSTLGVYLYSAIQATKQTSIPIV
jgi:hypothetical protein